MFPGRATHLDSLSPSEHVSLARPALAARRVARLQAAIVGLIASVVSMVGLFSILLPEHERMGIYPVLWTLALVGGAVVALTDRWIGMRLRFLVHSGSELRQSAAERAADLARVNAELQRRHRERAEILGMMAHELRTPLNAIIGHSRVLLDGFDGDLSEEQQADVRRIHDGGLGLLRVVNCTLDYARLGAGASTVEREPVQIWTVAEEVVALLRPLAEAKGLTIGSTVGPGLSAVLADEQRLRQALVNLMGNALKFTAHGHVLVAAEQVGDSVIIRVQDTGVGIAPDQHERIFEPFQRAERGPAGPHESTGLGLAIVRRLVEMMGGRIWLESEPGRGSTFFVALERARLVGSQVENIVRDGDSSGQVDVLLLAEDRRGRELAAALSEQNLSVRHFSGPDWGAQVRTARPRLVLADLSIRRAAAWDALAEVCATEPTGDFRLGVVGISDDHVNPMGNAVVFPRLRVITEASLEERLPELLVGDGGRPGGPVLVVGPDGVWRRQVAMVAQSLGRRSHEMATADVSVSVARRGVVSAIVVHLTVGSPGVPEVLTELLAAFGRRPCPLIVVTPPALTPSALRDLHLGALSWIVADPCPIPLLAREIAGQVVAPRGHLKPVALQGLGSR